MAAKQGSFRGLRGKGGPCSGYESSPSLRQPGFKSQHHHLPAVNLDQDLSLCALVYLWKMKMTTVLTL